MIKQPSTYIHDSHCNSEMIIPIKCFNPTEGKTIVVNVNKIDVSKKTLRNVIKRIKKLINQ